jgi:hypothetical protein
VVPAQHKYTLHSRYYLIPRNALALYTRLQPRAMVFPIYIPSKSWGRVDDRSLQHQKLFLKRKKNRRGKTPPLPGDEGQMEHPSSPVSLPLATSYHSPKSRLVTLPANRLQRVPTASHPSWCDPCELSRPSFVSVHPRKPRGVRTRKNLGKSGEASEEIRRSGKDRTRTALSGICHPILRPPVVDLAGLILRAAADPCYSRPALPCRPLSPLSCFWFTSLSPSVSNDNNLDYYTTGSSYRPTAGKWACHATSSGSLGGHWQPSSDIVVEISDGIQTRSRGRCPPKRQNKGSESQRLTLGWHRSRQEVGCSRQAGHKQGVDGASELLLLPLLLLAA